MPPRGWRKAKQGKTAARKPASQLGADGPPTVVDLDTIDKACEMANSLRRSRTELLAEVILIELIKQKGANEVFAAQAWMLARAFKKEAESGERNGE